MPTKLKVKRTGISSYFAQDFASNEISKLSEIVDYQGVKEDSSKIDVLITNTHTQFDKLSPEVLENLKLIIHPNSGYDNIPEALVEKLKAPIIIGNTIRAQAVSQYILTSLLSHFNPLEHQSSWDDSRKWDRLLLNELKVVIFGYGHIGRILNTGLRPLVKDLHVCDPYENLTGIDYNNADVVILACSLNKLNHHMINEKFLSNIKPSAVIINSARGELIDTNALKNFLNKNPSSFAYLDVFEKEPADFSEFKEIKNVKLSSHIAGVYQNINAKTIEFEYNTLLDFINLTEFNFKNKYQKMILQNRFKKDLGLI